MRLLRRLEPHLPALIMALVAGVLLGLATALVFGGGEPNPAATGLAFGTAAIASGAAGRAAASRAQAERASRALDRVPSEREAREALAGKTPDQLASEVDRLTGG